MSCRGHAGPHCRLAGLGQRLAWEQASAACSSQAVARGAEASVRARRHAFKHIVERSGVLTAHPGAVGARAR